MSVTASFLPLPSPQVVHLVCKWRYGTGLWSSGTVIRDVGDRRQSVSRQPSFTLSEWTDAQEDLLDMDPVPQTPVFEIGTDTRTEADAATLTVTPVGLQERSEWAAGCLFTAKPPGYMLAMLQVYISLYLCSGLVRKRSSFGLKHLYWSLQTQLEFVPRSL